MSTGVKFKELDLADKSGVGFVYKSWMGNYKPYAGVIPNHLYAELFQIILDRIIKRDGCKVILAIHPDYPDQYFGFACLERSEPTLHYIYVKRMFRRTGVGTDLLEHVNEGNTSGEFNYTFYTPAGRRFLDKRGGKHAPKIVRRELP